MGRQAFDHFAQLTTQRIVPTELDSKHAGIDRNDPARYGTIEQAGHHQFVPAVQSG
jgi:hypothetical protein